MGLGKKGDVDLQREDIGEVGCHEGLFVRLGIKKNDFKKEERKGNVVSV